MMNARIYYVYYYAMTVEEHTYQTPYPVRTYLYAIRITSLYAALYNLPRSFRITK